MKFATLCTLLVAISASSAEVSSSLNDEDEQQLAPLETHGLRGLNTGGSSYGGGGSGSGSGSYGGMMMGGGSGSSKVSLRSAPFRLRLSLSRLLLCASLPVSKKAVKGVVTSEDSC
jgi:hypothetical protein